MTVPSKILLIDDHPVFLEGLQVIFPAGQYDLITASDTHDAKRIIDQHPDIDCIFLDINMPNQNGLIFLKMLRAEFCVTPIVIISASDDISQIYQSISLGGNGFIGKSSGRSTYLQCLETVLNGLVYLTEDVAYRLNEYKKTHQEIDLRNGLSQRQKEVLSLLVEGYTNQEISLALGIALSTVKTHVTTLISIFNCDNRTHCAAEARRYGIDNIWN